MLVVILLCGIAAACSLYSDKIKELFNYVSTMPKLLEDKYQLDKYAVPSEPEIIQKDEVIINKPTKIHRKKTSKKQMVTTYVHFRIYTKYL